MELHKIIYNLLLSQIQFGSYRYKDPLPKMEDLSQWFSVSLDTVKAAYHQLKKEGYITLTKKAGAAVNVELEESELNRNIQTFFSPRKEAIMNLCESYLPLFRYCLWYGLKNASTDQLDELEPLCSHEEVLRPYTIVQRIPKIYGSLNNELLLKLIWHAFLFGQAPLLSLPANIVGIKDYNVPLLDMINLSRKKEWGELWKTVTSLQAHITSAIHSFYEDHILPTENQAPVSFNWNAYQSSSQRCYSLAIDMLKGIRQGIIAQDGFLPSPAKIADYMQVSTITVRRTIKMLNQLGITKSINGVGTKILSIEDSMENCDFNQPFIQKRLLNFTQSLQILAMTCGACAKSIITNPAAADMWKKRLVYTKENFRYESVVYASVEIIPLYTHNQTIRQIYEHLVCFLLWGYPLRSMHGSREEINDYYLPYIYFLLDCLENCDWDGLAAKLEELLFYELKFAAAHLDKLGIKSVSNLAIERGVI